VARSPKIVLRPFCVVALSAVAACGASVDSAIATSADEERARESPREAPALPGDGSLAALTAEVRQLRLAVEELARSQSETQALGMYLSAQQGRLEQADQQLAAVREQIESSSGERQNIEERLTALLTEQASTTSSAKRADIEGAVNDFRREQGRIDRQLQQARSRESELVQELRSEETRWNELIARLEALAR
jgi:chromosome segregation ATPase